jgi:CMP/dCMP kinase
VRKEMVRLQRCLAGGRGAVVEGRDIGTTVLPDAPLKVFLEAPATERARRRFEELREKGIEASPDEVRSEIAMRDTIDSSRENSPLAMAPDAVLIDTSGISVEQVVDSVMSVLRERDLTA